MTDGERARGKVHLMRNMVAWMVAVVVLMVSGASRGAEDKAAQVQKYLQGLLNKGEPVTVSVAKQGDIPDSPVSVYHVVYSKAEQSVGEMDVMVIGDLMIPGNANVVDLARGTEIARRYFMIANRKDFVPDRRFLVAGREDAPIKISVFSDYQCPYCKSFELEVVPKLLQLQDAALYHYEYPLPMHPLAGRLARAAIAYKDQTKKPAPDEFYSIKTEEELKQFVQGALGEGADAVMKLADSPETADVLAKSVAEVRRLKITATPTVLVNGYQVKPSLNEIENLLQDIRDGKL